MNRRVASLLVMALIGGGILAALISRTAAAADDPIITADKAVTSDLAKGERASAEKYLDADFSWIDTQGVMRVKEDVFRVGVKPAVPAAEDVHYIEHKYGNVVWLQENQGKRYAAHFWVKRPAGWKLLHITELDVHNRDFSVVRPDYVVPCINPCMTVPYTAVTANEKAALAAWQEQESGRPGMWAKHIADNFDQRAATTWGGPRPSKTEMVAMQEKAQKENPNRPEVAAVPALWVRTWDFGTAVVMIACQPTYGDKAYWASRVFAPLNGTWMMMESYHNYINASPVMTAVPLDKSHDPRGLQMVKESGK
ncbi:MAG: hypothetical protein ACRD4C_12465 [Candidatus Acidiferrales bacterium]